MSPSTPVTLCDVHEARAIVGGVSRSTLYAGIRAGRFPKPIMIGAQGVRWFKHELEDAIRAMAAARDGEA